MSIREDFRRLISYYQKKNKEANVERNVVNNSIVENEFYADYSSFTAGLQERLDSLLGEEIYKEVVYAPSKPEYAKYFVAVMEDPQFEPYYHMAKTVGGEFSFRLKDLDESWEDGE